MPKRLPTAWPVLLLEAAVVAYFAIGKAGYEPRLAVGPLSLNMVLQALVLATLCVALRSRTRHLLGSVRGVGVAFMLTVILGAGAVSAQNTAYAWSKPIGYAAVVLPVFALAAIYADGERRVARWLLLWALLGGLMAAAGVAVLLSGVAPARLAVAGGGGNVFARMVGSATVILVGIAWPTLRARAGWLPLLAVAVAGVTLVCSGSKTALLGLGLALAALGALRGQRRLLIASFAGVVMLATGPYWARPFLPHADEHKGAERILRAPDVHDPTGTYGARLRYFRRSIDVLRELPVLGVGTGDWARAAQLPTGRRYPHNIALEMACELGIAGLGLLGVSLMLLWRRARTLLSSGGDPRVPHTLVALWVFWFFNAQLSGDLLDNRHVWLPLLLLDAAMTRHPLQTDNWDARTGLLRPGQAQPGGPT